MSDSRSDYSDEFDTERSKELKRKSRNSFDKRMGDSDEEYDRRRVRDKFRRERSDYQDRAPGGIPRRDDWPGNRDGNNFWGSGQSGKDRMMNRGGGGGGERDYGREYGPGSGGGGGGSRRERYGSSPGDRSDMSPPTKRGRNIRDFDDRGYDNYGSSHSGNNWPPGDSPLPLPVPINYGLGGNQAAQLNQRPDQPKGPTQPPMMTFKQFLAGLDDSIDDTESVKKYNEYKMEFKRKQINDFFQAHKDEEWFKSKYHPEECVKRKEEQMNSLRNRLNVFLEMLNTNWIDSISIDVEKSDQIIRLLDAAVIKLEGGTDFDLNALDEKNDDEENKQKEPGLSVFSVDVVDKPANSLPLPGSMSNANAAVTASNGDDLTKDDKQEKEDKSKDEEKESESKQMDDGGDEEGESAVEKEKDDDEDEKKEDEKKDTDDVIKTECNEDDDDGEKLNKNELNDNVKQESQDYDEAVKGEEIMSDDAGEKKDDIKKESPDADDNDDENKMDDGENVSEKIKQEESNENEEAIEKGEVDVKDKEKNESDKEAAAPKPRALHKTSSIFIRNLAPAITKQEVEALCKKYPGFLRVALAEPQSERRFYRRGWVTFERNVQIRDICWNLNSVRLRDCELGAIVNRDLSRRIRSVNGIASHKNVVRADIRHAAKIAHNLDEQKKLWSLLNVEQTSDGNSDGKGSGGQESSNAGFGFQSKNPLLKNITDYLIEEASAEEEELLGAEAGELENEDGGQSLERDESLIKVLDRLLLYLRIVHSIDYYSCSEYPNEDEMPNRIGIMHARGAPPSSKVTIQEINDYIKNFEIKISPFLLTQVEVTDEELSKLGKKDAEKEVEKFIESNTQELEKEKWLCPLSGKKFKGPTFVRKHILNKHGEKLEEVRKNVDYFNNYLLDAKRPQLPEHPANRPAIPLQPGNSGRDSLNSGGGSNAHGNLGNQPGMGGGAQWPMPHGPYPGPPGPGYMPGYPPRPGMPMGFGSIMGGWNGPGRNFPPMMPLDFPRGTGRGRYIRREPRDLIGYDDVDTNLVQMI